MVSIFLPEKSKKMHKLPPLWEMIYKETGRDKKTIQNPGKGGFFT